MAEGSETGRRVARPPARRPGSPRSEHLHHALPDLIAAGLDVVFCGTAAGARSAFLGRYYAGPGNRFWITLHEVGLTDRLLEPVEFRHLLKCGIGLTDIAKSGVGNDTDIARHRYDAEGLRRKLLNYAPRALAFNGKNAARRFFDRPVGYGRAKDIGPSAVFVLPSTSGAARRYWDIGPWAELAAFVRRRARLGHRS